MNILKYVAYFVLTLTCMLYLLTLAGAIEVEDEKKSECNNSYLQ